MSALHPEATKPETPVEPAATTPVESTVQVPQNANENAPKTPETQEDPNWRAFREGRKKDREEREAAERRAAEKEREAAALKAAMEAAFSAKMAPTPQAYQQYYGMNQEPEESEDQIIERKVIELLAKKEEQYNRERQEREQREYPNRLLKDLPDFNSVCSQENLDYLDYHYPEISRPLQRLNEGYDKWYDTYHAVKKLIPNSGNAKRDAARAEINSQKPRSMSSVGPSPEGAPTRESWQESERRRAENWERMKRTLQGIS
jgi:hypothetical protein